MNGRPVDAHFFVLTGIGDDDRVIIPYDALGVLYDIVVDFAPPVHHGKKRQCLQFFPAFLFLQKRRQLLVGTHRQG